MDNTGYLATRSPSTGLLDFFYHDKKDKMCRPG